ncbi:MAG: BolA protein [Candidatus Tokpelaia sp. JSC085]|nr:MAG: BolA protein [Candidatus Tokpelaia sp. JSC085]
MEIAARGTGTTPVWCEKYMMSRTVQKMIEKKLRVAFNPDMLDVVNESFLHRGHRRDHANNNSRPFGLNEVDETHFHVKVVSRFFSGMRRIDCHRAVYHVLENELNHSVHALTLEAKAPEE